MLSALDIQNVVLIERLSLEGDNGLVALTGETGAGKSILLDALGLALGNRADSGMVRQGADIASVTATFDLDASHPVFALLREKEINAENAEHLILRRTIGRDGRSKAFINDAPVSVQLLKSAGSLLVEIHGQFETQGLLDPATHGATLDTYAGLTAEAAAVAKTWDSWRLAIKKLEEAKADIDTLKLQEDYLRHVVAELDRLAPEEGEEQVLSDKRLRLKNAEKFQGACDAATDMIEGDEGIRNLLNRIEIMIQRLPTAPEGDKEGPVPAIIDALARARTEIDEAGWQIGKLAGEGSKSENLTDIEDRYFALREAAKKHRTTVDNLPAVHAEMAEKLRLITHQDLAIGDLEKAVATNRAAFIERAGKISSLRKKAADKLARALNAELPDLKLDKASFSIQCSTEADEKNWGPQGFERVQFMVSTNTGTAAGPLHKIASGGELSRLMLALKVILAETGSVPTLIFDEVDSGIGGATADAVGERLQRLANKYQVLVVTHSPQVAARAEHHWHVAKSAKKGATVTSITPLTKKDDRIDEIARMLSGAEVTPEAKAQAAKLLKTKNAA